VPFEAPAQAQGLSKAQARKLQHQQMVLHARPQAVG
jgi:hypothetical protein